MNIELIASTIRQKTLSMTKNGLHFCMHLVIHNSACLRYSLLIGGYQKLHLKHGHIYVSPFPRTLSIFNPNLIATILTGCELSIIMGVNWPLCPVLSPINDDHTFIMPRVFHDRYSGRFNHADWCLYELKVAQGTGIYNKAKSTL